MILLGEMICLIFVGLYDAVERLPYQEFAIAHCTVADSLLALGWFIRTLLFLLSILFKTKL